MPSTIIDTLELTDMRADVELTFPQLCIISTLTEVSDGQGGMTQSWTINGTVDARMVMKTGNERLLAGQVAAVGAYTLTVPHDASINPGNRATIDTINYRVLAVDDVKTWRVAIRCDCDLEVT